MHAWATAILGLWAAAQARPFVTVDSPGGGCPTATEVEGRLSALLPAAPPGTPTHRARLEEEAGVLRIRLESERGAILAERALPRQQEGRRATCIEIAHAVAVVLAAWEGDLRPELIPAPALLARKPVPVAASPQRLDAPVLSIEFGSGPFLSLAPGGAAPGVLGQLRLGRVGSRWGLQIGGTVTTPRRVVVGPHEATWWRWAAQAGSYARVMAGGGWDVTIDAGFAAGWLYATGREDATLSQTRQGARFSPAATAGIRLGRPGVRLCPWIGLGASAPLLGQPLTVVGAEDRRLLHPFEAYLSVGISFVSAQQR